MTVSIGTNQRQDGKYSGELHAMTTATEGLACSSAFFAPPSFRTNYTRDGYRYCSSLMAEVKDLPTQRYLSVEFPGVVKNLDKALGTLGGASALLEVCRAP